MALRYSSRVSGNREQFLGVPDTRLMAIRGTQQGRTNTLGSKTELRLWVDYS